MICPACGRPVAVARASCLYCGAPLAAEAVESAQEAARALESPPAPAPGPDRLLVVLDLEGTEATGLARALGLQPFEAAQRVRRGGPQLHRIAPRAEAEADRLRAAGLRVTTLPEQEVRETARPLLVRGGGLEGGALVLRAERGPLRVAGGELLLVVRGPIAREYQPRRARKGIQTATLEPGYRFHLHRLADPRPVELDPWAFECDETTGAAGSSLLTLSAWVSELGRGVPVDDGFRLLPPALAPVAAETAGDWAAALGRRPAHRPEEAAVTLDNVAQFRFYSAWRGLFERRRRG